MSKTFKVLAMSDVGRFGVRELFAVRQGELNRFPEDATTIRAGEVYSLSDARHVLRTIAILCPSVFIVQCE